MIYLLIVDDEQHITDWLYDLFTNQIQELELGIEFECYRAANADDALACVQQYKVDILLSDIYMPGMSGLEMLDIIHQNHPALYTIFLTGYSDFDDIYRATRSRNTRYLSKTEEDSEIIRTVCETAKQLTAEKERIDQSLLEKNMINMISHQEYMLSLLHGNYDEKSLSQSQLDWYKIPLLPEYDVLVLFNQLTDLPNSIHPATRLEYLNQMSVLFQSQFSYHYEYVLVDYRSSLLVWILQPKDQSTSFSVPQLRSTLEDFSSVCYDRLQIGLSFLIYHQPLGLSELWKPLLQLDDSIELLLGQKRGMILVYENNITQPVWPGKERTQLHTALRSLTSLQIGLEQGNRTNTELALENILPVLASFKSRYHPQAAELYFGISNILTGCINRLQIMNEIAFQISLGRLIVWSDFTTWQEAASYLENLCDTILTIKERKTPAESDVIQQITAFIDEHLGEDLSLTRIGECINYNPAYLSRLFKNITGRNISTLICERRLQKAVDLLLETNLTITQLSSLCGFGNVQYFITVFRKAHGITPQEYRTLKSE